MLSPEDGEKQIPYVLEAMAPPPDLRNPETETVATGDYSRPPFAIVFGRGYEESEVNSMRDACKDVEYKPFWLIADLTVETPSTDDRAAYSQHIVDRVRSKLQQLHTHEHTNESGEIVCY